MKSFKGDIKFELTVGELNSVSGHCNVLKDMSALPLEEGKKLQKNMNIISPILSPLQDEANLLNDRQADLQERAMKAKTVEEQDQLKKERKEYEAEVRKYNGKKHPIMLFTVSEEKFPKEEEREKFGIKKLPQGQGQPPLEVERYTSFLELIGLGIITEKP